MNRFQNLIRFENDYVQTVKIDSNGNNVIVVQLKDGNSCTLPYSTDVKLVENQIKCYIRKSKINKINGK